MKPHRTNNTYYSQINLQFLGLLWAHIALVIVTAFFCHTSIAFGVIASVLILSAPTLLVLFRRDSVETSLVLAVALVCFSALLIHSSNGMTELHFHVFTSLGIIIVLAQPLASLAALIVVAIHHVAFYFLFPSSLINYEAGLHILIIHALFAVATGLPAALIAKKFKAYVVSVSAIVQDAERIGHLIVCSTHTVQMTSESLAFASVEESSALSQTSKTVLNLAGLATENAKRSNEVSAQSTQASKKSQEGSQAINDVSVAVREIRNASAELNNAVNQSNQRLDAIVMLMKAIGSQTQVIDEIVFQTKLLSFNASIEAARAGEHGNGFSVVANEVGKLAELSGRSARDINGLVAKSIHDVDAIVLETRSQMNVIMLKTESKIETCFDLTQKCGDLLNEISEETQRTAHSAISISQSTDEQAIGIHEISQATASIESTSGQNSKLAQKASEAAEELKHATDSLTSTINSLKTAIGEKRLRKTA